MKFMKYLILVVLLIATKFSFAQKNKVEHTWFNEEKTSKIEIYKSADGKFYGKIVWLLVTHESGKPRTDIHNPEKSLQSNPLINLIILKGFTQSSSDANVYENGTVYDPKSGKTYCGKMTYGGNSLKLKGYICGFSLLGKTSTWTLAQ